MMLDFGLVTFGSFLEFFEVGRRQRINVFFWKKHKRYLLLSIFTEERLEKTIVGIDLCSSNPRTCSKK